MRPETPSGPAHDTLLPPHREGMHLERPPSAHVDSSAHPACGPG